MANNQCSIYHIKGIHCRSCEILLEESLSKVKGVERVEVSEKTGTATIYHSGRAPTDEEVAKAVNVVGYQLGQDDENWLSRKKHNYLELVLSAVYVVGLYLIAQELGIFTLSEQVGTDYSSLLVVVLTGLVAGLSTCAALVGSLVAGVSVNYAKIHPDFGAGRRLIPHLFFHIGRVGGFFFLGGIIGALGMTLHLSPLLLGILTILTATVMLLMGVQLLEIFPKISRWQVTLPKSLQSRFGIKSSGKYSHIRSAMLGALTFFLPCGFTQAMQVYAVSTGSIWSGALTMAVFAIGTIPGLLGIGVLTAWAKGAIGRVIFKSIGLAIIVVAISNLSSGLNLMGIDISKPNNDRNSVNNITVVGGVQIVKMDQLPHGYNPDFFKIKKGIPVRWIINSKKLSCASALVVPSLGIQKQLQLGENVIEFIPNKVGEINFTCSMGKYRGKFQVE